MSGDLPQVAAALRAELEQPQPCISSASIALGVLQQRLMDPNVAAAGTYQDQVGQYKQRFQEQLLQPALARALKAKTPEARVLALAKFLGTKLAKAPAHKQPLHAQFVTSALQDGKKQLDCLGIATTVLALAQHLGQQLTAAGDAAAGQALAGAGMVVSDDHCWLVLQQPGGQEVHLEVTSCKQLTPDQMNGWLYAGGHGLRTSLHQVVLLLVAHYCPEEVPKEGPAQQLKAAQQHLLEQLTGAFPQALCYSVHFRWGLVLQEQEVQQIQAAADAGDTATLQQLVQDPAPPSQQRYALSAQLSSGRAWHPVSCIVFGWLDRLAALLYGTNEDILVVEAAAARRQGRPHGAPKLELEAPVAAAGAPQQPTAAAGCELVAGGQAAAGSSAAAENGSSSSSSGLGGGSRGAPGATAVHLLPLASSLLLRALQALGPAAEVLRRYQRQEGTKAEDQELLKEVEDLLEWWVEALEAMRVLQGLLPAGGEQGQAVVGEGGAAGDGLVEPGAAAAADSVCTDAQEQQEQQEQQQQQELLPSVASEEQHMPKHRHVLQHHHHPTTQQQQPQWNLMEPAWLSPLIVLFDAMCCYYGDGGTLQLQTVEFFLQCAACFTPEARAAAALSAASSGEIRSCRLQAALLEGGGAGAAVNGACAAASGWVLQDAALPGQLQLPTSRKKRRV